MPIREQSDDGNEDGTVWTHFDTTPIMSTYLVAFVVADYVRVPNEDGTVNMWCRSKLAPYVKFAQEVAEKSGRLLTEYTNSTDKVPKMDHVAVPRFRAGAMENWGLIIYIERSFAYDERFGTIPSKQNVAVTAAHEMAHQWFGNVVSPLWWSHVWLNEGFASFFQNYILNQIFEDWRVMEDFVVTTQQSALHIDIAKNMKPITFEVNSPKEIESLFSYSSYGKESEDKHVDDDRWWIPLTFATQTNPNFSNTLPTHWLRPQDQNITIDGIDPNDWIIVNLQQMGTNKYSFTQY
ncbi:aminopeptidase n [Lasius niger]|uniref:glutamyl aminopeptidase n=1 Tax=Lasius niger TaxID=67767 RepID=A0A0J7K5P6_LASNI|nr:aminopeptidase n [Lasius niger]